MAISKCPNCNSSRQYRQKKPVSGGGGQAPNLLTGLGGFWGMSRVDVVLCQDCGLIRQFARSEALMRLTTSDKWERVL